MIIRYRFPLTFILSFVKLNFKKGHDNDMLENIKIYLVFCFIFT